MPIVRLGYPAYPKTPTDDRGINKRLGEAHVHDNLDILDGITQQDIDDIRAGLDADLSKITDIGKTNLNKYVADLGYVNSAGAIKDINYLYSLDGWKDISTLDISTLAASSDKLVVKKTAPNKYTVDISDSVKSTLSDVSNKYDKVLDAVENNITLFGPTGKLKDSKVTLDMLQTVANMSDEIDSDSDATYASSKAISKVNDKLDKAIAGIGKLRGAVYNAFASQASAYSIATLTVDSGGYGYVTGDKFGIVGQVDAELTATANNDGKVISFTVNNGGAFLDNTITKFTVYPKSNTNTQESGQVVTVKDVTYTYELTSTLRDIQDPMIGDTCYVNFDELHDNERSMYTYRAVNEVTNGWVYTSCVAAFPMVKVCSYT